MEKLVLHVPKWQGELVFSKEVLVFAGMILLLFVGILFCFWGYKFFRTILFMGIGTASCYGGYLLAEPLTGNLVLRMILTVTLTFVGVCFVYFLDIIFGFILDRLGIRNALGKRTYLFAAPLGALLLGLTIYYMIWRDVILSSLIAIGCLTFGLIFQNKKRKKQVRFKSYDDLLKLSRPAFDGSRPEDETAAAIIGTAAAAEGAEAAVTALERTEAAQITGTEAEGGSND